MNVLEQIAADQFFILKKQLQDSGAVEPYVALVNTYPSIIEKSLVSVFGVRIVIDRTQPIGEIKMITEDEYRRLYKND